MKGIMKAALAAGFMAATVLAADAPKTDAAGKADLSTATKKASYAIGNNIGKTMKTQGLEIDFEVVLKAMKDGFAGNSQLTDVEMQEAMMNLQKEMQSKAAQVGEKAKKEGADFLAANKSKEGVKEATSTSIPGAKFQYKVLKDAKGAKPKASDVVKVHYRGTFIDGTEFDSSYKRGEPIEFPLDGVIKGWTDGVQLMSVGSKYQFFFPGELAYGEAGNRGIPPNSTLIFEVELLDIVKNPGAAPGGAPAPK